MWIKKLGEVFKTVAGGAAWVCEEIISAVGRATVKFSATGKKEASSESSA